MISTKLYTCYRPRYFAINIILVSISAASCNQRTSGPVNAHLTPGPGIYFNVFIHVYSPRAGADNPLGTNVDVNRKPLSLCRIVASFKIISTRFFMFFHMYIAPGRGRQTPGVKILMSTERPYPFDHLLQVLKKISF